MANYATVADLTARVDPMKLAALVNQEKTVVVDGMTDASAVLATSAAIARMTTALEDATVCVDDHLQHQVDMTITENLDAVKPKCCVLAIYFLYQYNGYEDLRNPWAARYKQTLSWLRDFAQGRFHSKSVAQQPESRTDYTPLASEQTPVFSDDNLFGYTGPTPTWT